MDSKLKKCLLLFAANQEESNKYLAALNSCSREYKIAIQQSEQELRIRRARVISIYYKILMLTTIPLCKEINPRSIWAYKRHGNFWEKDVPSMNDRVFKETFRMSRATFEILCEYVKGITKQDSCYRKCIPLQKRVAVAVYTLKSSAEYETVARLFGVSKAIVSEIFLAFCQEVWQSLRPIYLTEQLTNSEKVDECVHGFEKLGFPQCLGAIDGCHIKVRPPGKDCTDYYNYKGWYSTVLFALVDYRYRFLYISVGCPGRCNDSKIFQCSKLNTALKDPFFTAKSKTINGVNVPVGVMGDSAFRFANNLMKPYPFQVHPPEHEKMFNYQLSKCRRVVENAFGHLKARFRRIGKGVDNHIKNVPLIIKAACSLHNFLNCDNDVINHKWIEEQTTYESSVRLEQPEHTDAAADFEAEPETIRRAIANSFYSGVVESPESSSLEMDWDWLLVEG
ncbi:uncharacterized protein LOC125779312 [Bactrocera dorsalis]|uniref:Uncharacterized protein LOC125779312 n=1 Tax=Bactrocera dorsalis TaxID=27457 RepID=A0ABM3K4Y6_BACDO|nr:uncharacterized protein LOC125779312 [Bactrocera dorsalis]